jgi:hypothetical protein
VHCAAVAFADVLVYLVGVTLDGLDHFDALVYTFFFIFNGFIFILFYRFDLCKF